MTISAPLRPGSRSPEPGASLPRTRSRLLIVAITGILVAAVIAIGSSRGSAPGSAGSSTAPASWSLPSLTGPGRIRLADFRGRPTVVNFFASWCTACRGELPGLAAVSRRLRGTVQFVGVNSMETGDGAALARQFGIDWWPLARDVDGQQDSGLHDAVGARGLPATVFYDPRGRVLYQAPGALAEQDLLAHLRRLYGAAAA